MNTYNGQTLSWINLASEWSSEPILLIDNTNGEIYEYKYKNDSFILYRFISKITTEDSFYLTFDGNNVSELITSRS